MTIFESLQPYLPVVLLAAGIVFLALIVAIVLLLGSFKDRPLVRARKLMTANEQEFFKRLKQALPQYDVLPQVAMGAVVEPLLDASDSGYQEERKRFSQKIIDFVVYQGGDVLALIELDDRTHDAAKDAERDKITRAAGLTTLRFDSRAKPSVHEIRRQVSAITQHRSSR